MIDGIETTDDSNYRDNINEWELCKKISAETLLS